MADIDEELRDGDPEEWEEQTLNLIKGSEIDQEFSALKSKKKGRKTKHKIKRMSKPMVLPSTILEFMDDELREAAIRYLSTFLVEKREEDQDNYDRTGFLIFHSFGTMTILLQELVDFLWKIDDDTLGTRSIKRLANVLTIFQCVAANSETRQKFVDSSVPNFLIPLIQCTNKIELFDNIRAMALSVIGILCQGREPTVIKWAIESNMLDICTYVIDKGSELTKVIAMHILEAILQDSFGIQYICNPTNDHLLRTLIRKWNALVALLEADQDFSPRLLFHTVRCYILLCTDKSLVFPLLKLNSTLMERYERSSREKEYGNRVKELWSHGYVGGGDRTCLSGGMLGGFSWPPRLYTCSFCNREFRSAQALGGHMNVHRRDRALLRHSSPWDPSLPNSRLDLNHIPAPNPSPNPKPNSLDFSPASDHATSKACAYTFPSLFSPLKAKGFSSSSSSSASSAEALQGSKAVKALFRVGELKSFLDMDIEMYTDIDEDLDLELRLGPS
ncbi:hypothetical protein J5N97_024185 [Dioscorea zingiberensis]|uniref:C2H2-type domain-containing protein n=1 Tax=Dioscorea zingiberensis TaxID=325984 RepID=A0A9D5C6J7_9LILI|nr:hypothetical protein J5N97_024185 [Dioscorea zingiberensis]